MTKIRRLGICLKYSNEVPYQLERLIMITGKSQTKEPTNYIPKYRTFVFKL